MAKPTRDREIVVMERGSFAREILPQPVFVPALTRRLYTYPIRGLHRCFVLDLTEISRLTKKADDPDAGK